LTRLGLLPQDNSVYQGGFNPTTFTPLTPYLWVADTNTSIVYKITEAGDIKGAFQSKSGLSVGLVGQWYIPRAQLVKMFVQTLVLM
jgi:hypothetical protein